MTQLIIRNFLKTLKCFIASNLMVSVLSLERCEIEKNQDHVPMVTDNIKLIALNAYIKQTRNNKIKTF